MSISTNFPTTRPSLLLDFANVGALDPRITFTRASTGTYYDGVTTAKSEENLLLQSQDFTTTWTTEGISRSADTSTAPDGTNTADTITENSSLISHRVDQTVVSSGIVTLSVFAKLGTGTRFLTLSISKDITDCASATFDLSLGANTQTQANGAYSSSSATIVAVAQGFYRCSLTTTSNTVERVRIALNDTGTPTSSNRGIGGTYTGDGTSSIILWGAQLEQRSAVTAYTATTTQSITNYIPVLQTAAANVARFDHNPTTNEALGLLVEEQRTNLLTYSAEFDNAAWGKTRSSITANTIVAPDGTLTGDKLVDSTDASTTHFITQSASFTSGTAYTITMYAKQGEIRYVRLGFSAPAFGAIQIGFFDLQDGVVTSTSGTVTTSIGSVGNGWWRIRVTATATATTSDTISINLSQNGTSSNYTGDGYSGIFIWGAQLEVGAFPTSYIATTSAQVTRSADVASMTGTNFSSWFNQDQGSLYLDATPKHSSTQYLAIIGDGNSAVHGIGFFTDVGSLAARVRGTGGSSTIGGNISIAEGTAFKAMLSYAAYDNAWAYNGEIRSTGNTSIKPENSVNLRIGTNPLGSNIYTGTIKKLSFYPLKLTDAELNALTQN